MHKLELLTGLPINERFRKAGTVLAIVDKPDPDASGPAQVNKGVADLLVRQKRAKALGMTEAKADAGGKRS